MFLGGQRDRTVTTEFRRNEFGTGQACRGNGKILVLFPGNRAGNVIRAAPRFRLTDNTHGKRLDAAVQAVFHEIVKLPTILVLRRKYWITAIQLSLKLRINTREIQIGDTLLCRLESTW
ncbi:MAG: hypothetical protein A2675_03970 [Candidatus Yonathbacteria bacterium RIFCSPHIGHO2_01_FULL_51_10]|uniref:Uncharacterized protein n=1 Tax=Candidatus Yonathbacteria bacterium RIFCSPHIGHO2_01_FULL_51_10 TaxID=1802723 RepID=A0A1G2S660_9BACT|nr:MAG: hypothetical protein A2675_03970 [Candidatus Yonathbacteria bacterium RIFCSPHIGHO2_01_FULL_51_10]